MSKPVTIVPAGTLACDLLVIGGGINGAGIARDAAGRGLNVVLCEQDDLGAHTSSASSKLIHGGLRYLQYGELRADGGGARSDLLMQLMADTLGVPVLRPRMVETTALGVAQLAGLAVGYWQSTEELARHWQLERSFMPAIGDAQRAAGAAQWRRAVQRAQGWAATAD